ncbi:MAG: helix-turn-helix transcriptional regulator [Oscillospiraceae bacterium]|nr:helix-turn-helix transcriptional regulator [Oscillospiraceae bacterium]
MKNDLHSQIGLRIREKREALGLSREKLAECIDISPQFLAEIELGRKGMSSATLYKICSSLSASADYIILGRTGENDLTKVNELLRNLDPKYLPYLENLIQIFILALNK